MTIIRTILFGAAILLAPSLAMAQLSGDSAADVVPGPADANAGAETAKACVRSACKQMVGPILDLEGAAIGPGITGGLGPTQLTVIGPQACFFLDETFGGAAYCLPQGAIVNGLETFNNAISSIRLDAGVAVLVCRGGYLDGPCERVLINLPRLFAGWDNDISSIRVM